MLNLRPAFSSQLAALRNRDPDLASSLVRVIRNLDEGGVSPSDTVAVMPPDGTEWFVRRVPSRNVWVWFRCRAEVTIIARLSFSPPVPSNET